MTIDIEVEITDGFPHPEDAKNKITSIAIHSSVDDKYYAFALDEKKRLTLESKDNVVILRFDDEFSLLQSFFSIILGFPAHFF